MNEEIERFPSKKRTISQFLAREMIYDFVTFRLSEPEHKAFEAQLDYSPELRRDVEYVKSAIEYCDRLRQTQVTPALIQVVSKKNRSPLSVKMAWRHSSPTLRFAIQAAALTGFLIGLAPYIPSHLTELKLPRFETVTEIQRQSPDSQNSEVTDATAETASIETKPVTLTESNSKPVSPVTKVDAEKPVPPNTGLKTGETAPAATSSGQATTPEPHPVAKSETSTSEHPSGKRKGFVFRGNLFTKNPEEASRSLISYIETNGGKKAGEVDLGWRKREGYYFHFEFSESQYPALLERLKNLGRVRIERFPHSRVMPENSLRIILLVETPAFPVTPRPIEGTEEAHVGADTEPTAPAPTETTPQSPSP